MGGVLVTEALIRTMTMITRIVKQRMRSGDGAGFITIENLQPLHTQDIGRVSGCMITSSGMCCYPTIRYLKGKISKHIKEEK